jgi:hypothetical protein
MPAASTELLRAALIASLGLLLILVLRGVYGTWLRRRHLANRFRKARQGESRARDLLEAHGYAVIASQALRSYILTLDGAEMQIALRADYLVTRGGLSYVAEVKTGAFAPQIRTGGTRRQLLEYRVAFDVDGVLLVDAEQERVHVVGFPLAASLRPKGTSVLRWVVLGIGFACLIGLQWR